MRSILILVVFGMLLLQPGVLFAETYNECITRCYTEMASSNANCPPPSDESRMQCVQENQAASKSCIDSCPKDEPAEPPKEMPADTPKEEN
jgi:hypothetical protein